jgi:hypothetical protein
MLPKNVLYYGQDNPLPERTRLRAGPLSLIYEEGDLRYIKLGHQEILRRVYVAIRDRNWGTVLPKISNVQMDVGDDSFRISYDVENRAGDIDFFWQGSITGDVQGTITFTMAGEARSTFLRNRIGFCILHPMACAGAACRIEHVNGEARTTLIEESAFPQYIAPQLIIDGIIKPVSPFEEMRALSHEVLPGLWAEVRFTGDIFEMEDQRNWTDASYKTYCTPLRLPFPVELQKGMKISQSLTMTLKGELPHISAKTEAGVPTFSVAASPAGPLPRLGLGVASHGQALNEQELSRLKMLNLAHLRVDLNLGQPGYDVTLRQAAVEASQLGIRLEVALHLSDGADEALQALLPVLAEIKPAIWAWLIFHENESSTTEKWLKLARERLTTYDPAAQIGGGTDFFFTELNCVRPPVQVMDLVSYSINPQIHAFDNASLIETLEAQASTVESARQFVGDLPLAISPVSFKMRFNPNATGPEPEPEPGELPPQVDVRQMSLFGAGWTVGSLKYLSESGAQSLTYYETTGWRGVMERAAGSPIPEKFHSLPGGVFPLYHVLADVGEFAGGEIIPATSSDPLRLDGLALHKSGKRRVIVANLTSEPQQVTVRNLSQQAQLRHLNETNVERAMRSPEAFRAEVGEVATTSAGALDLELLPYALIRIDIS